MHVLTSSRRIPVPDGFDVVLQDFVRTGDQCLVLTATGHEWCDASAKEGVMAGQFECVIRKSKEA